MALDIATQITNLAGQTDLNNQVAANLLGRVGPSQDNQMRNNIIGALLGGGLGAVASQFDNNVSTGGGALFGALAGGLGARKMGQTFRQNAFSNASNLLKSNNDIVSQLMELQKAQTAGDAIDQARLDAGLGATTNPLYGASDAVFNANASRRSPDAMAAAIELANLSRSGGLSQGLGVAMGGSGGPAAGSERGNGAFGAAQPLQAPQGLQTDPNVIMGQSGQPMMRDQTLQGGVSQGQFQLDPAIADLVSRFGPAVPDEVLKTVLTQVTGAGDTGLTQGVEGARVPSQNRKDDATARKTGVEADYVPFEAQSKRISAGASASNAAANNTRANAYASIAPSVIARNNAFGENIKGVQSVLTSLDKEISTASTLLSKTKNPQERQALQDRISSLQVQSMVMRSQLTGGPMIDQEAASGMQSVGY